LTLRHCAANQLTLSLPLLPVNTTIVLLCATLSQTANAVIGRGYSAVYYLNSTGAYVLASSVLKLHNGTLEVDVPLPGTNWLEVLRNNQEWLIDVSTSATRAMQLRHHRYVMSARCMTPPEFVNSDGFNPSAQSYNGTQLTQCPVFLVQGMPWSTVQAVLRPGFVWQVSHFFWLL
jgi:hypothetical protein